MFRFIFLSSFIFFGVLAQGFGQSTQKPDTISSSEIQIEAPKAVQLVKLKKRRISRQELKQARKGIFTQDHAVIVENLKKRRKAHQKMRKNPALTDPMYFGHRKMPNKSHKKRQYCQECQIVH